MLELQFMSLHDEKLEIQVELLILDLSGSLSITFIDFSYQKSAKWLFNSRSLFFQEAAVMLVGKLAEVNPAMILPRLRKTLVEAVSQMAYSGQARSNTVELIFDFWTQLKEICDQNCMKTYC